MSIRKVGSALKQLEAEGLIARTGFKSGGGTVLYSFPGMAPFAEPDA